MRAVENASCFIVTLSLPFLPRQVQDPGGVDQVRPPPGLRLPGGAGRGAAATRAGLPRSALRQPANWTAQVRAEKKTNNNKLSTFFVLVCRVVQYSRNPILTCTLY